MSWTATGLPYGAADGWRLESCCDARRSSGRSLGFEFSSRQPLGTVAQV